MSFDGEKLMKSKDIYRLRDKLKVINITFLKYVELKKTVITII